MWSQRPALSYFSKGPGVAFVIRSSTMLFGDNEFGVRFWSPLFAAGTSLLLYYFARRVFSALAGFWTVVALNVTPIFNLGSLVLTIDPLSIFFWVAAFYTFWLALERSPNFSWWWPVTGSADWSWVSLQIYQRTRADLDPSCPRARPSFAPGISAPQSLSPPRRLRPLHDPADHLEFTARLDHARASQITRRPRRSARCSSVRTAFLSRRTFRDLFAPPFSRPGLGGDRELAARAAEFQSAFSALVRTPGLHALRAHLGEQGGRAKLGRTRVS